MRRITVIGAGEAGLALVKRLRQINKDIEITLIDKNPYYFHKKEFISSLGLNRRIDLVTLSKELKINFIQAKLEGLNLKRRRLHLKQIEDSLDFDILVIATGLTSKKLDIKGEHYEGVFYFSELDPFKIKQFLGMNVEISVRIQTLLGIKFALALRRAGKELSLLCGDLSFLGEKKKALLEYLQSQGCNLYLDYSLTELIGEGTLKAIKVLPFKIFSSELLFIESELLPNLDFLEERLELKDNFFTSEEDVYCVGDLVRRDIASEYFYLYNQEEAKKEALVLADFLLGGQSPYFSFRIPSLEEKERAIQEILKEQ